MLVSFGVIADDFTGACDVGVQFRKYGLETAVLTCVKSLDNLKGDFDVVVIDTESRNDDPETAYKKVREAVKALKKIGVGLVYKKIDSTLRGNIGAELGAVMDELNMKATVVAPAFPIYNRTTINGRLLVNGVPLERTEFAEDLLNPVKDSHVATLIGHQTRRRIGHINLSKVRSGMEPLKEEIQSLIGEGIEIVVADAGTQDDLARIARVSVNSNILPCGSAGLAEEVSRLLISRLRGSRLIVISGSVNSVTLNQIATVEKELEVRVLEPDLSKILTSEEGYESEVNKLVSEAEKTIAEGKDIIIRLARSKNLIFKVQKLGKDLGMNSLQTADKLLSVLSETFKKIIENHKFAGVILIGGDTAFKIMNVLNADGIKIERDVLPGIPMGKVLGGKYEGLRVVTKAGGFGDDYAIVKVIKYLRGEELK